MDNASIAQYAQQLRSRDPAQRRAAIIALGKSGSPAALGPLGEVYRGDPDADLRDLALRAGQFIRQQMSAAAPAAVPVVPAAVPVAAPAVASAAPQQAHVEAKPRPVVVSDARRKQAKELLEAAVGFMVKDDTVKAVAHLRKALETNPTLQDDSYFLSVAGAIMGKEGLEAVEALRDRQHVKSKIKEVKDVVVTRRIEKHVEATQKVRWSHVLLDVFIYVFLLVCGPAFGILIFSESIQSAIAAYEAAGGDIETALPDDIDAPAPVSPASAFLSGGAIATLNIVGIVVQSVFVHIIYTSVRGGKGTLPNLMISILGVYNRNLPILFVILYLAVWLTFQAAAPFILTLGLFAAAGYYLIISFKVSGATGKAYDFGKGNGLVGFLIGNAILSGINIGIAIFLYPLAAAALLTVVPTL